MRVLGILFIVCAVLLGFGLRRLADLRRMRRYRARRVGDAGAALRHPAWRGLFWPSALLGLIGLILLLVPLIPKATPPIPTKPPEVEERPQEPPPVAPEVEPAREWTLELSGKLPGSGEQTSLSNALARSAIRLSVASAAPDDLLPGVLEYPWDEDTPWSPDDWRRADLLRDLLSEASATGAQARIVLLKRIPGAAAFRYRVPSESPEPVPCSIFVDAASAARLGPILAYAMDHSLLAWQYEMQEVTMRPLTSPGVIRYARENLGEQARLLAALLDDTLGLTGISVAPAAEPMLTGLTVNLTWKSNARFLEFAWALYDHLSAEGAADDPDARPLFSPGAWETMREILEQAAAGGWSLRRSDDYRADWLERYSGGCVFKLSWAAAGSSNDTAACRLPGELTKSGWRIHRVIRESPDQGKEN